MQVIRALEAVRPTPPSANRVPTADFQSQLRASSHASCSQAVARHELNPTCRRLSSTSGCRYAGPSSTPRRQSAGPMNLSRKHPSYPQQPIHLSTRALRPRHHCYTIHIVWESATQSGNAARIQARAPLSTLRQPYSPLLKQTILL